MEKKLNKKDLINIFIRSNFLLGSFNFERMQAIGFCVSLLPALRKVYKDDKPAMAAAMKRHLEFFNTQPFLATPIMGITAAMEEKKANGADISDQTISGVKVGLMGPLAGVGDPIFWGTLRPVLAALGAGIALTGSIMGPLIFFLVFNAIRLATNWYGVMYGYSKGTELVDETRCASSRKAPPSSDFSSWAPSSRSGRPSTCRSCSRATRTAPASRSRRRSRPSSTALCLASCRCS